MRSNVLNDSWPAVLEPALLDILKAKGAAEVVKVLDRLPPMILTDLAHLVVGRHTFPAETKRAVVDYVNSSKSHSTPIS